MTRRSTNSSGSFDALVFWCDVTHWYLYIVTWRIDPRTHLNLQMPYYWNHTSDESPKHRMLQRVTVCFLFLFFLGEEKIWKNLHTKTHCTAPNHTATHCNTLQHSATHLEKFRGDCQASAQSILALPLHLLVHCNILQHATNTLQYTAAHHTHRTTLQQTATHCTTALRILCWEDCYRVAKTHRMS